MEFFDEIGNIIVAGVLGAALVFAAVVSGNQELLCTAIDGTYTPEVAVSGGDVCADGVWHKILPEGNEKPVK